MCGRYTLTTDLFRIQTHFGAELDGAIDWKPKYNAAPTQFLPVILKKETDDSPKIRLLKWGLIPSWAKDEKIAYKMINARSETVAEKPAYKRAFLQRRCLVPADGFYEWQLDAQGKKHPMWIRVKGGEPFAFAGIWESWKSPKGEAVETFTILTREANAFMKPIHDRMPALIAREKASKWLDPELKDPEALQKLIRTSAPELTAFEVSQLVNSPRNDVPQCIQPVEAGQDAASPAQAELWPTTEPGESPRKARSAPKKRRKAASNS